MSRSKTSRRGRGGRSFGLAIAGILAALLCGGAVAAWAYDDSKGDEIAAGITIGGVDVGGMTESDARRQLHRVLIRPLRRPIQVRLADRSWKLSGEELSVRGSLEQAVDEALAASRSEGLPGRIWRYVTGGEVEQEIQPGIGYSKPAVTEFIKQVAEDVNQDPVDATVQPSGTALEVVEAEDGVELRDRLLDDQVRRAALDPRAPRRLRARTRTLKPGVSTEAVADAYPTYLTLDRGSFTLRLWKNLKLTDTYTVAVGQIGLDTPAGLYSIENKAVDPAWHVPESDWAGDLAGQVIPGGVPENPLKARWLGIYAGAGIHGTSDTGSLGTAASHGCVRMAIPDVIELYDQVPVGTPIYIA